jgi:hypothetical protein
MTVAAQSAAALTGNDARTLISRFHAEAAARRVSGNSDTTPPVLKSISVAGSVNATKAGQFVEVSLDATDNLSGVDSVVIELVSPQGDQTIVQDLYTTPTTKYKVTELMGIPRYNNPTGQFNIDSEPGTWSVYAVYVADLAGNEAIYDQAQLAALGKNTFTVTNSEYTQQSPVLISGSILTPTLSLSTPPAGTAPGTAPLAEVSIQASENVTPAFEGIDVESAFFCLPPVGDDVCADEFGVLVQTGKPLHAATTLTLSGQLLSTVNPGQPLQPGTYYLETVFLDDTLGNAVSYTDTMFGGTVDLSSIFGTTTITVNP